MNSANDSRPTRPSGVDLSAVRFGSGGRRVVFLHGLTRGAMSCEPLLGAWGETWALDHAGHGASERLPRYRAVDYSGPVIDWMEANVQEPVWLYGHSLGAMVAPLAAAALPERVIGMVLEDPPFSTMGPRVRETDWFPYFEAIAPKLGTWMSPEELGELNYRSLDGRTVRLQDSRPREMLERMCAFWGMVDPKILDEVLAGRWMEGYEWPGLRHPALVFQADPAMGGMLRNEDAPEGATLHRLEGVGHLAHWARPDLVRAAVGRFMEEFG